MKKILLLSQVFYPTRIGTGKVLTELFFGLSKDLFDIHVVSGRTCYYDKSQKLLPAFEKLSGVKISRVMKKCLSKDKPFGRLYNYVMFFILASLKVCLTGLYKNKEIIFTVSNPPIMPLLGAILKNSHNKFVYLVHDLYPDIAIKLGFVTEKSMLAKIMKKINQFVFNRADKVLVLGRDMKMYLVDNYGVSPDKIEVFTNWSSSIDLPAYEKPKQAKFRLIYTGNIGNAHNLDIAVEAAGKLKESFELVFVGDGARRQSLQDLAANLEADNVSFCSYLEDKDYVTMLASADALLLSLEKGLAGIALPSKFYTYLAAGKPIIALTEPTSEVALTISEENCGVVIKHNDVDKLTDTIKWLINDKSTYESMANNVKKSFAANYEKSILLKRYSEFLLQL